tara:strand:+ start:188 stop:343 length:156 start_codon:yes stop_codon:yes gene_type:complete
MTVVRGVVEVEVVVGDMVGCGTRNADGRKSKNNDSATGEKQERFENVKMEN